jgi:hypothetical protein
MPYDERDPRSQLAATATAPRPRSSGGSYPPQYFEFGDLAPDEVTDSGSATWLVRSQTCCVAYTEARTGDVLERTAQPDEYMVLVPEQAGATSTVITIATPQESHDVEAGSVVVVPPGKSTITVRHDGPVVRIFSTVADDLVASCRNEDVYAEPDPNVAPFEAWPDPPAGHRVRVYRLADVPTDGDRFGRLWRCSTIMVNYFVPDDGPRDPGRLSPHHHDDFEQLSLQLSGDYLHHMRTPWTTNLAEWRDDEHRTCASPAVTIIPPPVIHTTQGLGHMRHQLIDIFSPPRLDFSQRPGWVLNADEYPMPS